MVLPRRLVRVMAGGALAASLLLTGASSTLASGSGTTTCAGGPVAGAYGTLVVTGMCAVVAPTTVSGDLVVMPGGALLQAFGGANLTVGGAIMVGSGGVTVFGCEPFAFPCLDDPAAQTGGTLSAWMHAGGNVTADGALAVLVHNTRIARNLVLSGGGGGVNCDPQAILMGFPAYATFEDVSVGGNANISGWRSCWLGFIRTTVARNVNFHDNVVADPDGNEIVTNTISGNLNCSANSPAPQVGDSEGNLNTVSGKATGQCVGLTH